MGELLRLRLFRPEGITSLVDARIRESLGPTVDGTDGLIAFYAARRGTDLHPERVLASVWSSEAALATATEAGRLIDLEGELGPGEILVVPLQLIVTPTSDEAPALLRVFRGVARPGELEAYVAAARQGTADDIASGVGPSALFLGPASGDDFVTVSAWQTWDMLQIATGSDRDHPVATRHGRHLVSGTAAHYEVIPHSASGMVRPPSVAD